MRDAGLAALVAPQVANSGVITARLGHVVLAGAQTATLDLYGDGLLSLDVTNQVTQAPAGATALVTNTGVIIANGGNHHPEEIEWSIEQSHPAIRAGCPALSRVRDVVGAYFAVIDEHPNLYWLLAREARTEGGGGPGSIEQNKEFIATALTAVLGDYLRAYGLDSGGAEPWAYGLTGLVQSTGEWWLQRRSMSRATVVDYVTKIIWAAISGMLRGAGIAVDPDQPFPETRPPLHAVPGQDAGLAPG